MSRLCTTAPSPGGRAFQAAVLCLGQGFVRYGAYAKGNKQLWMFLQRAGRPFPLPANTISLSHTIFVMPHPYVTGPGAGRPTLGPRKVQRFAQPHPAVCYAFARDFIGLGRIDKVKAQTGHTVYSRAISLRFGPGAITQENLVVIGRIRGFYSAVYIVNVGVSTKQLAFVYPWTYV